MSLEKAKAIFGWMPESELEWLRQQAAIHKSIVEVGSFMGRSTRALADNTRGTVTAVDTWAGSDEEEHRKLLEGKPKDWLFEEFQRNMAGCKNVFPLQRFSVDAANALRGHLFDFIFLDASHDYANIKADILAWRPLLAPWGLFSGHDYQTGAPGVIQAVDELLLNRKIFESIWYWQPLWA